MTDRHPTDETRELAALYALGALESDEARSLERHLQEGCPPCQVEVEGFNAVVGALGFSVDGARPRPGLRDKVMALTRTQERESAEEAGLIFVRSRQGLWQEVGPGIVMKILFQDPSRARTTALVRMAAGSRYAPHRHVEDEEIYVLEGGCVCGGQVLLAGDYHHAAGGSVHTDTYTEDGCLILVLFSPRNQMV